MEPDLVMDLIETLEGLRRYRRWYHGRSLPIRNNEMMLLMFLNHNLEDDCLGIQPSELGEMLRLTRPTITSLVKSLEKDGYVERINDEKDRRVVFVRPTNKGVKLFEKARSGFTQGIAEMIAYLGREDSKDLIRIMRRVHHFLEENQDGRTDTCGD